MQLSIQETIEYNKIQFVVSPPNAANIAGEYAERHTKKSMRRSKGLLLGPMLVCMPSRLDVRTAN